MVPRTMAGPGPAQRSQDKHRLCGLPQAYGQPARPPAAAVASSPGRRPGSRLWGWPRAAGRASDWPSPCSSSWNWSSRGWLKGGPGPGWLRTQIQVTLPLQASVPFFEVFSIPVSETWPRISCGLIHSTNCDNGHKLAPVCQVLFSVLFISSFNPPNVLRYVQL